MLNTWDGITLRAGVMEDIVERARDAPKRTLAPVTPSGVQRPKATAASAMNPRPLTKVFVYWIVCVSTAHPPASPPKNPEERTPIYLMRRTLIPTLSAAAGCSPQALKCIPNGVLYKINQARTTTTIAIYSVG